MILHAFNLFKQNDLKLGNKAEGPHHDLSKSANPPKRPDKIL